MSERMFLAKDLHVKTNMIIEIDDPQQLIDLAYRLDLAAKERIFPCEVTIAITPLIGIRYLPTRRLFCESLNSRSTHIEEKPIR